MKTLAIAIPTYQRGAVLLTTLERVFELRPQANELLVIDQTPHNASEIEKTLQEWEQQGRLRWIRHSPPSLPGARNRALEESSSDIVLFLDDDTRPINDDFVWRHVRHYDDETVLAVTGPALANGGALRTQVNVSVLARGVWCPADVGWTFRGLPVLRGNNHSVRASRAIAIGGYDEGLVGAPYGEDTDFAMRLDPSGQGILHDPECSTLHLGGIPGGLAGTRRGGRVPEWSRTFSWFTTVVRHRSAPGIISLRSLAFTLRAGPLRKEIVLRPWRWPWAWMSLAYAAVLGCRHAADGPTSRFSASKVKLPSR